MYNPFKKREQKPTPPWVMWVLIGGVVFAFISNHSRAPGEKPPFERTSRYVKDRPDLRSVKDRLLPASLIPSLKDVKEGEGVPAICGQTVKIAYRATLADDTVIEEATKDAPLTFTLGDKSVMPIFERIASGMKPGGTREINNGYNLSYGLDAFKRESVPSGSNVKFSVELLSTAPAIPSDAPYRVFDTQAGSGNMLVCGGKAKAQVTLWSLEGKKIYASADAGKPIEFTIGKSEVFLGLEQGVIGMLQGGARTMIVSPPLQKTLNGSPAAVAFPFPRNQTVLVDVEALP